MFFYKATQLSQNHLLNKHVLSTIRCTSSLKYNKFAYVVAIARILYYSINLSVHTWVPSCLNYSSYKIIFLWLLFMLFLIFLWVLESPWLGLEMRLIGISGKL